MAGPKYLLFVFLFASASLRASVTVAAPRADPILRAVADSSRSHASAVEQDENRKPEQTLRFAGIRPGQVVVDYLANAGYYTRLLSDIVGKRGHVYAVELEPAVKFDFVAPGYTMLKKWARNRPNVTMQLEPARTRLHFPTKIDVFWLTQNYHDLH